MNLSILLHCIYIQSCTFGGSFLAFVLPSCTSVPLMLLLIPLYLPNVCIAINYIVTSLASLEGFTGGGGGGGGGDTFEPEGRHSKAF